MKTLDNLNPIVVLVFFAAATVIPMFLMNPIIIALSLFGAISFFVTKYGFKIKEHLLFLGLFSIVAIINPIFYHNGKTVLFVVANSPITLEATFYGVSAAGMIISVLYWFKSFSKIMTSDKLLYIFGSISPKLSLIFSMSLRYVPLFSKQAEKVNGTQRALGLYKDDNIIDTIKGGSRVFSVMVTWALENGIITADSMVARGYGIGKRSFFSPFRFCREDIIFIFVTLTLFSASYTGVAFDFVYFQFYPSIETTPLTFFSFMTYFFYAILVLLPTIFEITEEIRWKFLLSKT